MRVWIDQVQCVGNGVCEELCPELFVLEDGDIAYVRTGTEVHKEPKAVVPVPPELEAAVVEAADECPAACIYVEAS